MAMRVLGNNLVAGTHRNGRQNCGARTHEPFGMEPAIRSFRLGTCTVRLPELGHTNAGVGTLNSGGVPLAAHTPLSSRTGPPLRRLMAKAYHSRN